MKNTMSNEYANYLDLTRICNKIHTQYGGESDEWRQARQKCITAHKKWSDMCLDRLNKQSGKKRNALYEAIMDIAKCGLSEACEYLPERIENLFV